MTHADRAGEPATAVCAARYYANHTAAHAFVFVNARFTVYAHAGDRYHIGEEYTLLLVPSHAAPLSLEAGDVEFLRHCLRNAADRWGQAIARADAGVDRPQRPEPVEACFINVEPTLAGYRAASAMFADELGRVERLTRMLDKHLDAGCGASPDGDAS